MNRSKTSESASPNGQIFEQLPFIVHDSLLAKISGLAQSTIRVQRLKRKRGLEHWLKLSPVYLGRKPGYLRDDVIGFLNTLPKTYSGAMESNASVNEQVEKSDGRIAGRMGSEP